MRVAVFRSISDGRRTADRLVALGHEAVLAPVLDIVPTGATIPAGTVGHLVFTSAQAPRIVARHPGGLAHIRDLPCWCVGHRTAAAAAAAGFAQVVTGPGDAARLATTIAASHKDNLPITLVVGRDRKSDLEVALHRYGIAVSIIEAYAAEAVPAWPRAVAQALRSVDAALHYSRRSAMLAHRLADQAGLDACFSGWAHHCLSMDVASALVPLGIQHIRTAVDPSEGSLLDTLRPT